ncbi:MAG: sulfite exporter TauE/SafE family protein [Acidobacteria bacterium]|nr:sulfite exporter TauE/SafE family protein [Acidobacteriota bacterium]
MRYLIVSAAALAAAFLTLFSGFGLGTLLMPVLALFFPVEMAVAGAAAVHLANNLFKVLLLGKYARLAVVVRFGVPAGLFALAGAWVLGAASATPALAVYGLGGRTFSITPVKVLVAGIVLTFALMDFIPRLNRLAFDPRYLGLGGALSGFFGGLSGHQGALRTAFLSRAGLGKEALLGTMILCAVVVDAVRLPVYAWNLSGGSGTPPDLRGEASLLLAATLSAFVGSWIGARLVRRVTLAGVHRLIGVLLVLFALALGTGFL